MTFRLSMAVLSGLVSIISLIPYIRSVLRGDTKPHFFTWFVWTILLFIIFGIQVSNNAGIGSFPTGVLAIASVCLAIYSWIHGIRKGDVLDWVAFIGSLAAIPAWLLIDNPIYAACIAVAIDVMAFYPTVIKTWKMPYSENLTYYIAWLIKFPAAFFALEKYDLANAVYPATWSILSVFFVIMVIIRRKAANK